MNKGELMNLRDEIIQDQLYSMELTERETKVLKYIEDVFYESRGATPSYREIQTFLGLNTTSSVYNIMTRLEKKGYIKRSRKKFC